MLYSHPQQMSGEELVHSPRLSTVGHYLTIPKALCPLHGCALLLQGVLAVLCVPLGAWSHSSLASRGGHWFPLPVVPWDCLSALPEDTE